ncbi:MAG: hypothetical protein FWE45_03730 [Firmicutes bacterium]|nr:hypothetical protein [Bacillota bacterium]
MRSNVKTRPSREDMISWIRGFSKHFIDKNDQFKSCHPLQFMSFEHFSDKELQNIYDQLKPLSDEISITQEQLSTLKTSLGSSLELIKEEASTRRAKAKFKEINTSIIGKPWKGTEKV